jgi:thiol-disulfide isomerase/thioredoxin
MLRLGPLLLPWGPLLLALGWGLAQQIAALATRRGLGDAQRALTGLLLVALVAARAAFVARHLDGYAGVVAMLDIRDLGFDAGVGWAVAAAGVALLCWRRAALRRSLPAAAGAGALLVLVAQAMLRLASADAGPPLPDIALPTLDGAPLRLRTLRGEPLVVNLWATWCPPCRRELPMLVDAGRRAQGLRIVLVDQREAPATVRAYLREAALQPRWLALDEAGALASRYQTPGFPTTLFFDADGRLRRMYVGELSAATLQQGIEQLRDAAAGGAERR